jgi:hypothetical protein
MAWWDRTGQVRPHNDEPGAAGRWTRAALVAGGLTVLLGVTGMVSAAAVQASQPATAHGGSWTVQTSANQPGAEINVLSAVSCTSARWCTAVGSYADTASTPGRALAERWNGKSWRLQAPAKPAGAASYGFFGVSCSSVSACTAVGTAFRTAGSLDVNLAEAWNGKSWRVQATPNAKGATEDDLYAVSCTSVSACTAVGVYDNAASIPEALVERWNGKAWRIQSIPRPVKRTWLFGVSCSTARACSAVGYQNSGTGDTVPLAEAWNGTKWQVQTMPLPHGVPGGALSAVSCTSPKACTASGTNFGTSGPTLAERWNGRSWRVQPTPNPKNYRLSFGQVGLDGVSCTSATACTASGQYSPGGSAAYFAEAWNGKSWRLQTTPLPVGFKSGTLLGVSCAPTRCTAVGAYTALDGQVTLAMTR